MGISATISPSYQSHAHGVASTWSLTWGGTAPFDVYFWYDWNGSVSWYALGTYSTGKSGLSEAFFPCTGMTFTQELDVYDQLGDAYTTSHAHELGGNPC